MLVLDRRIKNFRPRTSLFVADASWVRRALAAEEELARIKSQPKPKIDAERHPIIVNAEAHLLFDAYVQAELERMSEKIGAMETGTFDATAADRDAAWKERNENIGHRAVDLEDEAHQLVVARRPEQANLFGAAA